MKLSGLLVLELNKRYNLVQDLSERESGNPEGVELELRVAKAYETEGGGFLGIKTRATPEIKEATYFDKFADGGRWIKMKPGDYILVETMERINVPNEKVETGYGSPIYLCADIRPRSTLQRCCVSLDCTTTNPGYNGTLTFGLMNNGKKDFDLEIGARAFKIFFDEFIGEIARAYSGQHQGGRVTSQGKIEVQN